MISVDRCMIILSTGGVVRHEEEHQGAEGEGDPGEGEEGEGEE